MRHESYFVLVKLQRIKVRGILVCARAAAADYSGARHFEVLKNVVFLLKTVFFNAIRPFVAVFMLGGADQLLRHWARSVRKQFLFSNILTMKTPSSSKVTTLSGGDSQALLSGRNALPPLAAGGAPVEPRLSGDLGVWLIILLELLTFAILFIAFAFARLREVDSFNASQSTLDLHTGAINTVLLITASWCVASAVREVRKDASQQGARWLLGAIVCGSGFLVLKLTEYADKLALGLDLSTNTFYMFYFVLTGFHFLHVVVGVLALIYLWFKTRRGDYGRHDCHALETGGAFWHMVDLLWIVLFPLVYVMR